MSRAWKDPDDVQQDILDEQKKTNRLLEQLLNELKNHFADGGKMIVSGLDEGDPKGDESVIIAKKNGGEPLVFPCDEKSVEENFVEVLNKLIPPRFFAPEERHEINEEEKQVEKKNAPLIIPYDLNGPRAVCPLCSRECVFDKIEAKFWCTHCRTHFDNPPKYEDVDPVCPKCGGPLCWHDLCSGGKYFCHECKNYFKMEKGGGASETTAWGDGYVHGWNDSWYARSPRTEFDKWKENLKPEDLIFDETDPLGDPKTKWAVFNTSGNTCDHCPARKICHELPGRGKCGPAFMQWAKTKAEE